MKPITDKQSIKILNALAYESGIKKRISPDSSGIKQKEEFVLLALNLSNNFFMENLPNVIRAQIYSQLRNIASLVSQKFSFWGGNNNGDQFIVENSLETSARTGDAATDLLLISPEPDAEVQVLELLDNIASDLKSNKPIQEFASLNQFTSWLNQRIANIFKSNDKFIYNFYLNNLKNYSGYNQILIDTTGLSKEEIAEAFEIVIGETIAKLGSSYTDEFNEPVGGVNFDNVLMPNEIGMIINDGAYINRDVNYLRKQFNLTGGNIAPDWGLGTIVNCPINNSEPNDLILLSKQKWVHGELLQNFSTSFGYALHTLETGAIWYGDIFLLSAPAIRITAGVPVIFIKQLLKRNQNLQRIIFKKIASTNKKLESADDKIKKVAIISSFSKLIDYLKKQEEILTDEKKSAKFIKDKIMIIKPEPKKSPVAEAVKSAMDKFTTLFVGEDDVEQIIVQETDNENDKP